MTYQTITYLTYIFISVVLTVWVGNVLFRNGKAFLLGLFDDEKIVESMNRLLLMGFYLVNFGYATFTLKAGQSIYDMSEMIELLSVKIGGVILVLGLLHFANMYIFYRLKQQGTINRRRTVPPPPPGGINH